MPQNEPAQLSFDFTESPAGTSRFIDPDPCAELLGAYGQLAQLEGHIRWATRLLADLPQIQEAFDNRPACPLPGFSLQETICADNYIQGLLKEGAYHLRLAAAVRARLESCI